MNNDAGTFSYHFEADTSGLDKGFESVRQKAEDLVKDFRKLDKASDFESLQNGVKYLTEELEGLEEGTEEYIQTARALEYELSQLSKTEQELNNLNPQIESSFKSISTTIAKSLGGLSTSLFKGISTGLTGALTTLTTKGIQATDFLEKAQVSMGGLTGSMEEGTKAMSIAANFWQNNPFNRFDVTSATKQLVQYGRTTNQIGKDLDILGDISLSTGVEIDTLARAYGRVSASGRAMTIDLEMMSDRGVPIYRELQNALGATQAEVRELASRGKIDFETFQKAMESSVNPEAMEAFQNTLARQMDRLSGSISILAGDLAGYKIVNDQLVISATGLEKAWTRLIETLATGLRGEKMREGLEKIGNALAKIVDKIVPYIEPALNKLGELISWIGDHTWALVPIFAGAGATVLGLASKVPILGDAVKSLGGNLKSLLSIVFEFAKGHKVLASFIAVLAVGFASLIKNDEEFRKSLSTLASSIVQIVQKLAPIVTTLVDTFLSLATDEVVTGLIKTLVKLFADLASVIASIPEDTLILIVTVIAGLKLAQISPWILYASAIAAIVLRIRELVKEAGGVSKILDNIKKVLVNAGTALYQAGGDLIGGFVKGIYTAWGSLKTGVYTIFSSLITNVKKIFKIHSPSVVMEGIGQDIGLGLAQGIDDSSSAVNKAMNNLATDILKTSQKVISNKKDFGLLNSNQLYKEWKKVANLFTIGSQQYESAIEQMEEARKQVNLEIIALQKNYNDTLDESIDKIKSFYGLFDDVNKKAGKNSQQIIKTLGEQNARTQEWVSAQSQISSLGLEEGLVDELKKMGVESVGELSAIANMTSAELSDLNTLWLQKQELATQGATDQLSDFKDETLKQISDLADGIDGETVQVEDVGGRLVASISEGITGALPTLENSFAQLNDYIKEAQREIGKSVGGGGDTFPTDNDNNNNDDPFGIKKIFDQITENLQKGASKLGVIAAGLGIAAIIAKALGIAGKLGALDGLASKGGILGALGKIFGGKGKLGVGDSVDLSGLNKTTSQLGETSKGLSKANEWLTTITKAALAIAAIAVAIAAIAGAIWVMDKALADIDWGTFISKLGMVVVATVAMGALAYAVSKLEPGQMALGAGVIVLLALDVAAIGAAIGIANYAMEGIKWSSFLSEIAMMAIAIVAMGALAAIAGIPVVAGLVALGAVVIVAIAADIIVISTAIGYMDAMIPDDLALVTGKIGILVEAIGAFELLAGVAGVFALVEGLGLLVIKGIAEEIAEVAISISVMAHAIPNDLEKVQVKLDYLKSVIKQMSEANLGGVIKNVVQSAKIRAIKPTIEGFRDIAWELWQIYVITPSNFADLLIKLSLIRDAIKMMSEGEYGGLFKNFLNSAKVEQAVPTVRAFAEIGRELMSISGMGDVSGAVSSIGNALRSIADSAGDIDRFNEVGGRIVGAIIQGVTSQAQALISAGQQIQSFIWQGVQSKFADEYQQGVYLAYSLKDGILSVIGEFQTVGGQVQSKFWQGVQNRMQDEYYQGRAMGERFRQGLYDVDYGNAGWWAVQGFINGAWGRAGSGDGVYHTGWWIADNFLKGLKDRGEQGSPWKTTQQSGQWAVEGLIDGMESMEGEVINEAETLADSIVNALDLSDTQISPELSVRSNLAPSMSADDFVGFTGISGAGVVINQQNTNYTEYDVEATNRDLSYMLSQV